ncbi:MAG: exodeoxyribonuclease VII small subunit [Dehalococcoidia bacterium]
MESENQREEQSYESLVEKLNNGLKSLESGELSLDQSIELYKQCMELVGKCNEYLDKAEIVISDIRNPS